MKFSPLVKILLSSVLLVSLTWGYPEGAPLEACGNMYPEGHHVNANTTSPPYDLLVNSTALISGGFYNVTLKVKDNVDYYYEGVFVQARLSSCANNEPVGSFIIPSSNTFLKTLDCSRKSMSAVTHQNHPHTNTTNFIWKAPDTLPGPVYFRATVVKNTQTFWTNVFSPHIFNGTSAPLNKYCDVQSTVTIDVQSTVTIDVQSIVTIAGTAASFSAVTSLIISVIFLAILTTF